MSVTIDTRQRLLDAAGPVFAAKGFESATVREICDIAEANLASVNYHFGSKEKLYVETVRYASEIIAETVPLPEWPTETAPEQKLHDFISNFLNRVIVDHEPSWVGKLVLREVHEPTQACATFVEGFVHPTFGILSGILDELLPAHVPTLSKRLTAFSIIGQCLHYRLSRSVLTLLVGEAEYRSYDVDLLSDHITSFSLAGIKQLAANLKQRGP